MKIIDRVIFGNIDMKKQTTLILKLIAVPFILASATNAIAGGGTHGCQIEVQHNYTKTDDVVYVSTYNGKDALCQVSHERYALVYGESTTVKAHAQGSAKCTLRVRAAGPLGARELCKNLPEGSRCAGGEHTIRVDKKGSLIIHEDGSCTKSE